MSELDIILKERSQGIDYTKSYHGRRMAEIYLKTYGMVLDYSSLGKEVRFFDKFFKIKKIYIYFLQTLKFFFFQSLIFRILSNNDENDDGHNQNATAAKLSYLAKKTKNNKYLVKNECSTGLLDKVYGASPKYVPQFYKNICTIIPKTLKKTNNTFLLSFSHPALFFTHY